MSRRLRSSASAVWLVLFIALAGRTASAADELRDPLQAPAMARPAMAPGAAPVSAADIPIQHIVAIDGRFFLVVGGRRLGVGARLGEARITRIDETAVWLTEAGVTLKRSLFAGVDIKRSAQNKEKE